MHGTVWMNQHTSTMNNKGTIALTVAALATGAALGILFAPASGRKTRRRIARKGREAKRKLDELVDEGAELLGNLKKDAGSAAERAREAVKNGMHGAAKVG